MKVFTIIVTYNGIKWIDKCLTSVITQSEVVVVDNNSSDNTINYIKQNFNSVIVLPQNVNHGFGKANNIGIRYALEMGADYVFLLNQDAFIYPECIPKLISTHLNNSEYGILSPLQLDEKGELLEWHFYGFTAVWKGRNMYSDFILNKSRSDVYNVDFVQAAAWLLPRNTLEIIGGFDPLFFHYGEDDNYCQRVKYHKLKVGIVPESIACHDSYKLPKPLERKFSEQYYSRYLRTVRVKYADINIDHWEAYLKDERTNLYKFIIKAILKFRRNDFIGFLRQLKLLNIAVDGIRESRRHNVIQRQNYL